jgi:hypothetical protein
MVLMAAGLVDSLVLSLAWTLVVLQVTATHGLVAAGVCSTAMLVGVALSAPAATAMSRRLDGRRLLRLAASVEAVLRVGVLLLVAVDGPLWLLAGCVGAMNVVAWTGYAGMRAEVAAAGNGATGLTWYGTVVASVEAVGVATAALVPTVDGVLARPVLTAVAAVYVLALLPTFVVAGGSRVPPADGAASGNGRRSAGTAGHRRRRDGGPAAGGLTRLSALPGLLPRPSAPELVGGVLMLAASAPTLLSVALAAQLHGRASVGPAAVAFTLGSLASPLLAARVQSRRSNGPRTWVLCAAGMLAGWALAPYSLWWLCLAQLGSGLCMTALEGLLDAGAARRHPGRVTAALARASASRALGSAAGTALLPLAVAGVGLQPTVGVVVTLLLVVAACAQGSPPPATRAEVREAVTPRG